MGISIARLRVTSSVSSIILRTRSRASGSRAIPARVAPVSARMGLKAMLPKSLTQISSRRCLAPGSRFEISFGALEPHALFLHGPAERAAGEKGHIHSGVGHLCADVTSDGAGSGNHELHAPRSPAMGCESMSRLAPADRARGVRLI